MKNQAPTKGKLENVGQSYLSDSKYQSDPGLFL